MWDEIALAGAGTYALAAMTYVFAMRGEVQRRSSERRARSDVGTASNQSLHYEGVPLVRCAQQWGPPVGLHAEIDVAPSGQCRANGCHVVRSGCGVQVGARSCHAEDHG